MMVCRLRSANACSVSLVASTTQKSRGSSGIRYVSYKERF